MTSIMLSAKDSNASRKLDILAAFEDTTTNREIVVCRAMSCKAPIHAEKWDDVVKDQDKIDAAFYQLCTYLNEFNSQMTNAIAKAAPVQHAVAEAKYDDDLGNPFGRIAVYHILTATAEKHQQKNLDAMLEQLSEYVASECKRAVDVGGYLERIQIQYLELIKAKETLPVLHSRILPRVLGKLSDGRHVGSERMDFAEGQKIGEKACEWQTLRDEDATRVSWEDVYLDLASTDEHVLTHCIKSHGGDPTGPAGRSVRFPVGVGFMDMGVENFEDGCDEQALGLAAQYESTFGKPATVQMMMIAFIITLGEIM